MSSAGWSVAALEYRCLLALLLTFMDYILRKDNKHLELNIR